MAPYIFLLITFSVLSAAYGYVGWRLITASTFTNKFNLVFWIILILMLVIPYLAFVLRMFRQENTFIDILSWVGYICLGLFSIIFAFIFAKDILLLSGILLNKIYILFANLSGSNSNLSTSVIDPSRREFIFNAVNIGIVAASAGLTGYGIFNAVSKPKIKYVNIPIENLPEDLDGFTIAQFTDLHVGPTIKKSFVEKVVAQINDLKPDLVVFTGDLVDGSVDSLREDVKPLSNLESKYGKFYVTGNHEYYSGAKQWVNHVKELGFFTLLNENIILPINNSNILLAGVTDWSGGQFYKDHVSDPQKAIVNVNNSDLKLLLAHQPKSLYKAADAGFDIQLSGHTHGGQYFPYNFMAHIGQPFIKGLNKFKKTWIYVNQGTGYWGPPLRIGAPSEITLLKIIKN